MQGYLVGDDCRRRPPIECAGIEAVVFCDFQRQLVEIVSGCAKKVDFFRCAVFRNDHGDFCSAVDFFAMTGGEACDVEGEQFGRDDAGTGVKGGLVGKWSGVREIRVRDHGGLRIGLLGGREENGQEGHEGDGEFAAHTSSPEWAEKV